MWSKQHYNALAKEIRELFPITKYPDHRGLEQHNIHARTTLTNLALRLAKRFQEDNPRFNPHQFLDACSPDTDLYPLAELWEE